TCVVQRQVQQRIKATRPPGDRARDPISINYPDDEAQHQQCGHHSSLAHTQRLRPVNGPSLRLCS
ncbi:hypothetical protein KUCAC02_000753, partial [Chaenocephalus aceratus]